MKISINTINRNFTKMFLLVACLVTSNLSAMKGVNLQDYALPQNSDIRTKLDSIFKEKSNPKHDVLRADKTWNKLNSDRWIVGTLTTQGNNTKFVVKGEKYLNGQSPAYLGLCPQTNISRIAKHARVNKIIERDNLGHCIRTSKTWVYPISGNDEDLGKDNITDHDVIIVEEEIKNKEQENGHNLSEEQFNGMVKIAKKGPVADLKARNIMIDEEGRAVLVDLEDVYLGEKQLMQKKFFPPLLREVMLHKVKCLEEAKALEDIRETGLSNSKPAVRKKERKLRLEKQYIIYCKANAFEIGAGSAIAIIVTALTARNIYRGIKTQKQIQYCLKEINTEIEIQKNKQAKMSDNTVIEITKRIVTQVVPKEARSEIFEAFATISLAKTAEETDLKDIKILGKEYKSPEEAVRRSKLIINSIWRSDWLIPYKIARGTKAAICKLKTIGRNLINVFNNKSSKSKAVTT